MFKKPKKLIFILLIIILASLITTKLIDESKKNKQLREEQTIRESFLSKAIQEENKKQEEARIRQEEKKRQEEETRKFIIANGPCRYVPVLMYHHVGIPTNGGASLYVHPDNFASQMNYLNQRGYTAITLNELMASLISNIILPPKPVVITFDDGYRDFYQYAYPVLRQFNQKATVYVITQLVGGSDYLNWEQLREIAGNPLITIGNHTLSHRSINSVTAIEIRNEIISAKNIIRENLGINTDTFAYPFGAYNLEAEQVLQESGFNTAVTTQYGLTCAKRPFEIPRVRIGNSQLSVYGL